MWSGCYECSEASGQVPVSGYESIELHGAAKS
jgi:hypothetical protein